MIKVSLSGAFELSNGGESIELSVPAQRVLAFLALHDDAVDRGRVSAVLWRGSSSERAAGSLRSALWRIRRCGEFIVGVTSRGLQLSPAVRVDVREAVAWARRIADVSHSIERERLRQLRLHALEVLSQRLARMGRHADAIEVGLAALRNEPLRESAHRAVISVHLAEGNPSEALRQYGRFRELLRAELGLEPSPLIKELVGVA